MREASSIKSVVVCRYVCYPYQRLVYLRARLAWLVHHMVGSRDDGTYNNAWSADGS